MPAFKNSLIFLAAIGIAWFFSSAASASNMNSLSSSFTIEVNGSPIAGIADDAEHLTQASTGSEPALFTLKDGRLQSGEWVLGRSSTEDRSLLPKKVMWFKPGAASDAAVRAVTAHQDGESYLLKFANACLIEKDGKIFATLMGGDNSNCAVIMR